MRNKLLALLLCISVGAGAIPSFAAESGKTASPAVAVEAGESAGTEKETGQDASTEAAASDAGELPDSETAAADGASEAPASESDTGDVTYVDAETVEMIIAELNDTWIGLLEKLDNIDKKELMQDLKALQTLLQSEEFLKILDYEEIKILIQELLASVIDFAKSDPDLCIEVLDKLGVPTGLSTVIMEGLRMSSLSGDMVRKLSIDHIIKQLDTVNYVIGRIIEENDVLKAVSSLQLNGGTE